MDFPLLRPGLRFIYFLPSAMLAFAAGICGLNGWAACLLGLIAWSVSCSTGYGCEISPDSQQIREYTKFLGWRTGAWQPLVPVVGVTVKYFSELEKVRPASTRSWGIWNISPKRYEELVVMLSLQGSSTGFIINRLSLSEIQGAIDFAQAVGAQLHVPIRLFLPAHIRQEVLPENSEL